MEDLYDPEEKILCPYNSSHHIRRCKMSFHLVKCKQNYGEQRMIPCDFNATHMIPEPELQYHHQVCSDRRKIEARIVESRSRSEKKYPVPNIVVATEENWDDNCYTSYNPQKYTENSDVLRHVDVVSGAKRKNFRLGERQRLSELSRQNENAAQVQPQPTAGRNLPPHRDIVTIDGGKVSRATLRDKLKSGQDKVFLQYQTGPSENN